MSERTDANGVVFDVCPQCRGLWLDSGEIEALLRAKAGLEGRGNLLSPKPASHPCPRCGGQMEAGGLASPLLVVERCSSCSGTWLDAEELRVLRKLLAAAGTATADAGQPELTAATAEPRAAAPPPRASLDELFPPAPRREPGGIEAWRIVGYGSALVGALVAGVGLIDFVRWVSQAQDDSPNLQPLYVLFTGLSFAAYGAETLWLRRIVFPSAHRRRVHLWHEENADWWRR